jgi:cytochrome c oxidase assembly protein subunit 15
MLALARYAWLVLAWNLAVISWGAYVRATGSGAGCGNHWPLCNGDVLPRSPDVATLIEFSHRFTSGVALVLVVVLVVWTFRACRPGHPARVGAGLSLFLILTEAAVGAGLVLFELVADNATMARAMFMAAHLLNTFLLLAALSLTGRWLTTGDGLVLRGRGRVIALVTAGGAALLVAGASGAVAALGDTLFPASSLGEALAADLSASSHLLLRLRILHPLLAVGTAVLIVILGARLSRRGGRFAGRAARVLTGLTVLQVALGFLNVVLLAPVWLQLVHLLVADGIWIAFILVCADALATDAAVTRARAA